MDLGDPSSYIALERGTPVFASDGRELGRVEHVLADREDDIFEGIVLDTSRLPGAHRFADAPLVAHIYERGVVLTVSGTDAEALPQLEKHAAALEVGPDDQVPDALSDKLPRAWHHLKGQS